MSSMIPIRIGANPSGTIGLSAVVGSAVTFMRSDAAPTLSQSIVPTWTGMHTFTTMTRVQPSSGTDMMSFKIGGVDWRIKLGNEGINSFRIGGGSGPGNDFWVAQWTNGYGDSNTFQSASDDPLQTPFAVRGSPSQSAPLTVLKGYSSTNAICEMVNIDAAWATSTHASRKARGILSAWDTATRECIRFESDGSYGLTSIGGAAVTTSTALAVVSPTATYIPLVVKGAASQSGNMTEWQNSSGTAGARITSAMEFSNPTTSGSGNEVFGRNASSGGYDSNCVFGNGAQSGANQSCVFGNNASSTAPGGTVYGYAATAGFLGLAFGFLANAASESVALGYAAISVSRSVAIGSYCQTYNSGEYAFGFFQQMPSLIAQGWTATDVGKVNVGRIDYAWVGGNPATHATRAGIITLSPYYTTTPQEGIRIEANSGGVKVGLYGTAATIQYATTGTTTGFTANTSANVVCNESTFTGNTGSTAYTISDIVKCLKLLGAMAA